MRNGVHEPVGNVASFQIEHVRYLDEQGRPERADLPSFARDAEQLAAMYRAMVFVRVFDGKAINLQRTGKLGTYASCLGHEAAHVGIGFAMKPEDVFAPMYREYGAQFVRGVLPREVLLYWGGDERGSDFSGPAHDFPWCVPISTQCLHAAGAALAIRLRGEKRCAVSVCGDGGSSKADFYGAINAAGAWSLPLVAVIVNNQYAISVPRRLQTGAQTLAQKGVAAGLACVQADGNDVVAVRAVMERALTRARGGLGGTVVELVTYRLTDHTTADDARRYRDEAEVQQAWTREPLRRLRAFLQTLGGWDEAREQAWLADCEARANAEIEAYLAMAPQPVTAMFDYLYAELPPDLERQRAEAVHWAAAGREAG